LLLPVDLVLLPALGLLSSRTTQGRNVIYPQCFRHVIFRRHRLEHATTVFLVELVSQVLHVALVERALEVVEPREQFLDEGIFMTSVLDVGRVGPVSLRLVVVERLLPSTQRPLYVLPSEARVGSVISYSLHGWDGRVGRDVGRGFWSRRRDGWSWVGCFDSRRSGLLDRAAGNSRLGFVLRDVTLADELVHLVLPGTRAHSLEVHGVIEPSAPADAVFPSQFLDLVGEVGRLLLTGSGVGLVGVDVDRVAVGVLANTSPRVVPVGVSSDVLDRVASALKLVEEALEPVSHVRVDVELLPGIERDGFDVLPRGAQRSRPGVVEFPLLTPARLKSVDGRRRHRAEFVRSIDGGDPRRRLLGLTLLLRTTFRCATR